MVPISVGVRRVLEGCLDGVWMVLGWSCLLEAFRLLFLCPKMAKNGNGVTIGVTDRGYIFGN